MNELLDRIVARSEVINTLIHRIVDHLPHATEAAANALHGQVDAAFPVEETPAEAEAGDTAAADTAAAPRSDLTKEN